ncbi:MAG: hypothetical protein WCS70_08555 [Verrucomicrobiota bacterium]
MSAAVWFGSSVLSLSLAQTETNLTNALKLLTRAQSPAGIAQRIDLYEETIGQCRLITATSSNFCAAQMVWAICLVDLAQVVTQRLDSADYAHQAQVRLATAEQCAPQSWLVQQTWGRLLLAEAERQESAPKAAGRLLEQARQHFEKARQIPAFKGDHANSDFHVSLCLIRLAQLTSNRIDKLALYREVGRRCESAAQVPGFTKQGQVHGVWGGALLEIGKLEGQRQTLRQSIEHLQTALSLTANDLKARYNLACAYALLDNTDLALKELATCLKNDPTGAYWNTAQNDGDLESIRCMDEFRDLPVTH